MGSRIELFVFVYVCVCACAFVTHEAIVTNGIVWQNTLWLACEIVWLWNYIIAFNLAIYS